MVKRTRVGWTTASASEDKSRMKSKLTSAVSTNTIPERTSRAYWAGGYKRSEKDSDTFELTESGRGDIIRDEEGHYSGRSDHSRGNLAPDTWHEEEGIRVTQEISVQSKARNSQ
jgi:hypothetical protein